MSHVPSVFLLVPGPWGAASQVLEVLHDAGIAAECSGDVPLAAGSVLVDVVEDAGFGAAMAWGRSGQLPGPLVERADACTHAALVEVGQWLDGDNAAVVAVGRALRSAGGVAVRMEGSGAASPWDPWLENLASGGSYGAFVSSVGFVGSADGTVSTCGMHQFGHPDAKINGLSGGDASRWLESFCLFQIEEQPTLGSGHTFRPSEDASRRVLERWPDDLHHPEDGRHNPFGVWRFLPEGVAGIEVRNPVPTIMPSLVAMLAAAEQSGAPLTRQQVEDLVSGAPAVAMDLRDARTLERSRGYADIEPELAYDQWQIVRATL